MDILILPIILYIWILSHIVIPLSLILASIFVRRQCFKHSMVNFLSDKC
jgi:hypothetical protein